MAQLQEVTPENFEAIVLKSTIPVLVDFYASWCGPCRAAAPTIEGLADVFKGQALVVKFDVDNGPDIAMKYGVRGIPSFVVFGHGAVVGQSTGFNDKTHSAISEVLKTALAL